QPFILNNLSSIKVKVNRYLFNPLHCKSPKTPVKMHQPDQPCASYLLGLPVEEPPAACDAVIVATATAVSMRPLAGLPTIKMTEAPPQTSTEPESVEPADKLDSERTVAAADPASEPPSPEAAAAAEATAPPTTSPAPESVETAIQAEEPDSRSPSETGADPASEASLTDVPATDATEVYPEPTSTATNAQESVEPTLPAPSAPPERTTPALEPSPLEAATTEATETPPQTTATSTTTTNAESAELTFPSDDLASETASSGCESSPPSVAAEASPGPEKTPPSRSLSQEASKPAFRCRCDPNDPSESRSVQGSIMGLLPCGHRLHGKCYSGFLQAVWRLKCPDPGCRRFVEGWEVFDL
ncbi:hypothetical protein FN846DRAFT_52615, partial [Sphaerosporella brunnea]